MYKTELGKAAWMNISFVCMNAGNWLGSANGVTHTFHIDCMLKILTIEDAAAPNQAPPSADAAQVEDVSMDGEAHQDERQSAATPAPERVPATPAPEDVSSAAPVTPAPSVAVEQAPQGLEVEVVRDVVVVDGAGSSSDPPAKRRRTE